jgi:hypothetical protein
MIRVVRLLVLPLAAVAVASAQQAILGIITDSSGAAVPAAVVTVTNVGTNATFRMQANAQGYYTAPSIPVGRYSVTVDAPGFKKTVRSGITIEVEKRAQVDIMLQVGTLSESVEVVGEAPLVDTASATQGKVVDERTIEDLPTNGRNAFALMMLSSGVKPTNGPTYSGFTDRGSFLSQVSINGGPSSLNSFSVDGGNNNNSYYNDMNANPAVDAIQEFKVQSNTMSAEFGFTLGGVINVVTKSGTNLPHGTLYEFMRNPVLDARNAFAVSKGQFHYNQFGGSIGGPVMIPKVYRGKNRTFFFFNYEEYRYRTAASSYLYFPPAQYHQGDFSRMVDSKGVKIPVYDPDTTRVNPAGSGYVRDPLPDNIVPASRIDPVAANMMKLYPLPNLTSVNPFNAGLNYYQATTGGNGMRQYTSRVDQQISAKNSMYVRYMYYRNYTQPTIGAGIPWEVAGRNDDWHTRNIVVSDTHTFSPSLLNEARVSFARQFFTFHNAGYGVNWPQKMGLPADFPSDVFPVINNSITGLDGDRSWGTRAALTSQLLETMTWVHGRHTTKFGGDFRILQGHNLQKNGTSGSFTFATALTQNPQNPVGTGSAIATFLLGDVSSASLPIQIGQSQRGRSMSYFVQEDWKATRRLNLNLGLRYDYQAPPTEQNNGNINFDFGLNPQTHLPGRTIYAGQDYGASQWNIDRKDFGPRFGFAYDLFGNSTTVLRGGYSIFYSSIFNVDNYGQTQGFANTSTSYQPAGNNTNFPAFQFHNGLPYPPTPPGGRSLGPSVWLSTGVSWDEPYRHIPMSQQWSLALQRRLFKTWVIETTYTANHGTRLVSGGYDYNQIDPQYYALGLALQDQVPNPYAGMVPGNLGAARITRQQSLRPFPYIANITVRAPHQGNSSYNAFQLSVNKKMARGVSLNLSYTTGKLISDSVVIPLNWFGEQTTINSYQNGKYARSAERSLDPTDVSQRMVVSGLFELPFGRGKKLHVGNRVLNKTISGWQLNTITTLATGAPLVVTGANNFLANRPNSTGQSAALEHQTILHWFDAQAFVNPPSYTYGNLGRTLPDVRAPGVLNIDASILKDWKLTERMKLQFRAEAFNAPNHVNYGFPNTSFTAGRDNTNSNVNAGRITSARSPRNGQFGLKVVF